MSINISAQEQTSSDIKSLSDTEKMHVIFNELRSNRPRSLDSCDFRRLQLHKRFISLPNMDLSKNSTEEAPSKDGWKSAPNLMFPEQLKGMDVRENSSGDVPEIVLSSAELPVSMEPLSRDASSVPATLMPPAAAENDRWIETPLSVTSPLSVSTPLSISSPLPPVEAGETDTVTSSGRSDAGTDHLAVTTVASRRSLWNRTKRFVRRTFCCGATDSTDE
ncbi:unnamed protein product [Macrosiphum euphorbiae]|uniref:Uncharacterized protein n=1 Tax=Macrosiphum euphorbiae TaxID=13131 RepID=A0AAV0XCK1_9HEMI|nr:unnamed protein product [Macrosiphum euphorbiae]